MKRAHGAYRTAKAAVVLAFRTQRIQILLWTCILSRACPGWAEQYSLPSRSCDSVVGDITYTTTNSRESLLDIARSFDLGHDQIILANPGINRWLPPRGAQIILPSLYILPQGPRKGIVLNLAELRLYFYSSNRQTVDTFPVSVGDIDWKTPIGVTTIVAKDINPAWIPPPSIRREHELDGDPLPSIIPGSDPENPLGRYALRLTRRGYLIHGTDERRAMGIGMRVSHGCIRLYPEDIESLFSSVKLGEQVRIVDEPIKVGWRDQQLYLSVHRPLETEEQEGQVSPEVVDLIKLIRSAIGGAEAIDSQAIKEAFTIGDGIPRVVAWRSRQHTADEQFRSTPVEPLPPTK